MSPRSSRAPGRAGHSLAPAILLALLPACGLLAQDPKCRPVLDLRVCQDVYAQPLGRVYLTWSNNGSYSSHCIYVEGQLHAVLGGELDQTTVSGLLEGPHDFEIESACNTESEVAKSSIVTFDVEYRPQYEAPVTSLECGLTLEGDFKAIFDGLAAPFVLVDIFKKKMDGDPEHVDTFPFDPEHPEIVVPGITDSSTKVFFQFFDAEGYGSAIIGCPGECNAPAGLQVHQYDYGETGSIFLRWLRDGGQRGFEVYRNNERMGMAGALSDSYYLHGLEPGRVQIQVKALCWGPVNPQAELSSTVLGMSPDVRPILEMSSTFVPDREMSCSMTERGKIDVEWVPNLRQGSALPDMVDVLLRRGTSPIRYVTTLEGGETEFTLKDALYGDAVYLQFFDAEGFGSPLQGTSFRRGDANHADGLDLSDAITVLNFLFLGTETVPCSDAADANDDGSIDVSDGLAILNFLFLGDAAPPEPGHLACGQDPTPDDLLCQINCPGGSLP